MRTVVVLFVLTALAVANPKSGPKAGPKWAPSWSEAISEGRVLNMPVVVHRHGFY